jgi:Sulfotransferase domain
MAVAEEFTLFPETRPAVLVVSHERSGTHFLMNSLAACYAYVSQPRVDFDMPTENLLHHFSRQELRDKLVDVAARPIANIVKSHHVADFFAGELGPLTERYVIFYIYRNPVDVMLSFWRYMFRFHPWENPGPQVADPLTFSRATPFGRMLRYQTEPSANVLERWAKHVQGWRVTAETFPGIRLVRYEDLDTRYEATILSFATLLGRQPLAIIRPERDFNVVERGPEDPMRTGIPPDVEALRRLCRELVGDTMTMLGY